MLQCLWMAGVKGGGRTEVVREGDESVLVSHTCPKRIVSPASSVAPCSGQLAALDSAEATTLKHTINRHSSPATVNRPWPSPISATGRSFRPRSSSTHLNDRSGSKRRVLGHHRSTGRIIIKRMRRRRRKQNSHSRHSLQKRRRPPRRKYPSHSVPLSKHSPYSAAKLCSSAVS